MYLNIRSRSGTPKARLAYPIRNGIPIMLADEARDLDETAPHDEPGA